MRHVQNAPSKQERNLPIRRSLADIPGCSSLREYLEALELRDGGNGNGYALLGEDGEVRMAKAFSLPRRSSPSNGDGAVRMVLFHSREASEGSISDRNCHPFFVEGRHSPTGKATSRLVFAANGNEAALAPLARAWGDITDSEFIGRMVVDMGLPLMEMLCCFESNFFGFADGVPFVKKATGTCSSSATKTLWSRQRLSLRDERVMKPPQNYCGVFPEDHDVWQT
jgi:hypothetical protein